MINELMVRLEAVPITKGTSSFQKFKKYSRYQPNAMKDLDDSSQDVNISKLDISLNFNMEVVLLFYDRLQCCDLRYLGFIILFFHALITCNLGIAICTYGIT